MGIPVKLDSFEGPLDLLLHLIDKNKINIYDIPIAMITGQYLEYINQMEEKDLDIMSEFLVMAATLIYIKSKMLLPKEVKQDDGEEIDPRAELVERLLEYKLYKYISYELKDKEVDAAKVIYKEATIPKDIEEYKEVIDPASLLSDLTLAKLHQIFQSILKRQEDKVDPIRSKFGRIEKEEVNLSEKMYEIQKYGYLHKKFNFRSLFHVDSSKVEVIVTFLSLLELMKIGQVSIVQEEIFDDILITFEGEIITDYDDSVVLI